MLHVDDEPNFAEMAARFITGEDHRFSIDTATSPSEGLDRLDDGRFDCVVSDYDMPEQNGIDFLKTVRETHPDLPFILFTGKGSEEIASEAISAGVTDYLQKGTGTSQYTVLANRVTNVVEQFRSRRAITETQQKLTQLAEHTDDILFMFTGDWSELLFINSAYEEIWGGSIDELYDDPASFLEYIHPADRDKAIEMMDRISSGQSDEIEYRVQRPDGDQRWIHGKTKPIVDANGSVSRIVGYVRDITDRKKRERELGRKERRYQAVFNDPNILVGLTDTDGTVRDVNQTALEYIDADLQEVIGDPLWEAPWFDHSEAVQDDVKDWIARAATGEYVEFEVELVRPGGDPYTVSGVFRPVTNADGEVVSLLISDRDITESKQRERELEQTNALLSTLIMALPEGVLVEDESRQILTVNQQMFDLFELPDSPEDVIGADCADMAESIAGMFDHSEQFIEQINERLGDREPVDGEALALADGRTFERTYRPIELPDTDGHLWMYRDVTARNTRQQELETVQRRFEAVLENTTTPMFMKDDDGRYIFVNQAYRDLFDLRDEDIIGRTDHTIHSPEIAAEVQQNDRSVLERGEPLEIEERISSNGVERTFLSTKVPIYDTGSRSDPDVPVALFGIATDITERTAHVQQLEALNQIAQELMSADTREEVVEIGVEMTRDLLGMHANSIHLYDEAADALVPVEVTDAIYDLVGEPPTFTGADSIAWRVYQQGETLAVDDVHEDPDRYNQESPMRSELFLPLGEYGVMLAGSPSPETFDEQDVLIGEILAGVLTAALEQVERTEQLRTRERELTRQNDRLERFASIVSHDLRNPLSVATGRLELAAGECDSEHLDHVEQAHERMRTLIEDLLALSRDGETVDDLEPIALGQLVEGCWETVETGEARLGSIPDQTIEADRSRLKQLFENLMRNAVEHGGENVTVRVGSLADGFYVEDDGSGIPVDEREPIFEAGYSTGEDGTGFGLHIIKQIVDAHDWRIHVTDSDEGGARFEITGVEVVAV
ncbi:PAS domain-containing protein [Natronomonas marina]|uniref:PAS domain-containing protein n=1 Tax=Natronomonas marina TaxID=2961939 RepID=UPI0020C9CF3D|nr:PAS domain-containing protein [Natronomonas marina]